MSQLRSARSDDAQHETNDEIFDGLLEKHPEVTGKIGRTAHATKGLVKLYWARRLKNRDVRASPGGIAMCLVVWSDHVMSTIVSS